MTAAFPPAGAAALPNLWLIAQSYAAIAAAAAYCKYSSVQCPLAGVAAAGSSSTVVSIVLEA